MSKNIEINGCIRDQTQDICMLVRSSTMRQISTVYIAPIGTHALNYPRRFLYSIALNTSYNKRKITVHFLSFQFVSHPNCQQLLASLWYEGLPGFRRHNIVSRLLITFMIGFTFPLLSLFYLIAPKSRFGKLIRKPFIKFICHSASYITFLGKLFFSFWIYLLKLYKDFYDFIINIIKIRNVNCQIDMYSDFLINFRADSTKSLI